MGTEFLDLASKAKELGISDAALRARILSEPLLCWAYVASLPASADGHRWLPAWTADTFPNLGWIDHGSSFKENFNPETGEHWPPFRVPWYHIRGWVVVDPSLTEEVLTRGEGILNDAPVWVIDDADNKDYCLRVYAKPKREWVTANAGEYLEGGYWREVPAILTPADLFIPAGAGATNKPLSSRKEQSYLGIIAAMRALLRDKDGGGFPSEAKIIDQLVSRFGNADGVSKRNLESVFADATRTARDAIPPK